MLLPEERRGLDFPRSRTAPAGPSRPPGAGGRRSAALPPPSSPRSPRFLSPAAGGAARGRAGRERREPAAPCLPPPGRGAALPAPRLTSSMAATVFLHWAIRVVKLEAVGDL